MQQLHEFLDQWRVSRGWSLVRLADELGVSQSLVSKWLHPDERRRVRPNRDTLRRISEMTGVSRLELMRMAGYVDDADLTGPAQPVDPELAAVYAAWPRLSTGVREAIRILVGAGGRVSGPSNGRVIGDVRRLEEREDGEDWSDDAPPRGLVNCKTPLGRPITVTLLRPALAG